MKHGQSDSGGESLFEEKRIQIPSVKLAEAPQRAQWGHHWCQGACPSPHGHPSLPSTLGVATDQRFLILNSTRLESDNVCLASSPLVSVRVMLAAPAAAGPFCPRRTSDYPFADDEHLCGSQFGLLNQHSHVMLFDGHIPQGGVAGLPHRHHSKVLFSWMIPGGSTGLC